MKTPTHGLLAASQVSRDSFHVLTIPTGHDHPCMQNPIRRTMSAPRHLAHPAFFLLVLGHSHSQDLRHQSPPVFVFSLSSLILSLLEEQSTSHRVISYSEEEIKMLGKK